MMTDELRNNIRRFCEHADGVTAQYWTAQKFTHAQSPIHQPEYLSDKWCRILTIERNNDGTERSGSVYGFVSLYDGATKALGSLKTGDIHKAASYKAPAKHARGNVFDPEYKCATPHGIAYLR